MNTKTFGQLSQNIQISRCTTPQHVSLTENPDNETQNQIIERQTRFLKLPRILRLKLSSVDISQKIQLIGQKYRFELLRLANITRLIREYYFGEVRLENFPAEIEKRVGVNLLTAQEISRYIKQEIIDWDPWAEYIAKLPKMPIREIVAKHPKIAETEITAGYIELRGSEDLSDPTIKNWLQDYISHLGYEKHSQMDRTQYIFHSENGKNLSSQDREKLGIILRSFDENIPLPVDEENGEIVFESVTSDQRTANNNPIPTAAPRSQPTPIRQDSFIKPYSPIQQPQKQVPRPVPAPVKAASPPSFAKAPAGKQEAARPNFATQPNRQANAELNKYFNTPESPDIPSLKIHSITEHNEPRSTPQSRPDFPRPAPPQSEPRSKYKIIDPFGPRIVEPKIDGNIVDLSG